MRPVIARPRSGRGNLDRRDCFVALLLAMTFALFALLFALLAVGGCRGGAERGRAAGSAAWMDAAAAPLEVADLARMEGGGIGELFVEAASLDWQGGQPQVAPLQLPRPGRRSHATLVLRGDWPTATGRRRCCGAVAGDGPRRGHAPRRRKQPGVAGWHPRPAGRAGQGRRRARRCLAGGARAYAAALGDATRDALAAEGIAGAHPTPPTSSSRFSTAARRGTGRCPRRGTSEGQAGAAQLEKLEEPFLVGVVVRGVATLVRRGALVEEIAGASLGELAWNRQLRVRHGFSLEGVDRQVYSFTAHEPTRVGETRLLVGDDVRVVGTSTAHVQELRRQIAVWKLEHCLGELYYRLPRPGEALTLDAANLARVGGETPALPVPRVTVTKLAVSPGRVVVKLLLENASSEGSDLGHVDNNFVELWARDGASSTSSRGSSTASSSTRCNPTAAAAHHPQPHRAALLRPGVPAGARIESARSSCAPYGPPHRPARARLLPGALRRHRRDEADVLDPAATSGDACADAATEARTTTPP